MTPPTRNTRCKRLRIKDLLKIFENYEPSRFLVWEIVRTLHPAHTAALLFIMENVTRSYKADTLSVDTERSGGGGEDAIARNAVGEPMTTTATDVRLEEIDERTTVPEHGIVLCSVRPTLSLKPCERDYETLPNARRLNDVTAERDGRGNLTVFGLVKMMQSGRCGDYGDCDVYERIVMHNLRTKQYTQFSQNVLYLLFPEHMQQSRDSTPATVLKTETGNENCMHHKFMRYYESFYAPTATAARDSRTFRHVKRHRATYVRGKVPVTNEVYVQPRYSGYSVVINSTEHSTRTYNRHGELLQAVLYHKRFPRHATFEAVIVPTDDHGEPRSWRYAAQRKKNNTGDVTTGISTCRDFTVFIVDVFRVNNTLLLNAPFRERIRYARALECDGVRVADTRAGCEGSELWDSLERRHYTSPALDCFAPVNGVFLRRADDTVGTRSRQYAFPSNTVYGFQKNRVDRMSGDGSLRLSLDSYFPLDMAERCDVITVYAHDDQFYYACVFDRDDFVFTHHVRLDRVYDVWRKKPRYVQNVLYVRDACIVPMGIALLRVYHNENTGFWCIDRDSRRIVVGYETKLTTSMYDVPYEPVSWFVQR